MMNVCFWKPLIVGVSLCFSAAADCQFGFDSATLGVGTSFDDELLVRIGIQRHLDAQWWESEAGHLSAYLDLSLNQWSLDEDEDLRMVAFSPVFSYQFSSQFAGGKPLLEAGIGLSYISKSVFSDRDMGGNIQFEDRLTLGLRYDVGALMLTYLHYSNGGIYSKNAGMNSLLLNFRYFW
ncbi:acyloxyacyl hydrolase [Vibrio furnissii]|uniref:acyloxyacyl hydrolase n=1 Tax=Vibrio furnissii TaxID=29494 RepID=UPI001F4F4F87|nr:acyloxyacyl hydrolase [Vibrio furnissii]